MGNPQYHNEYPAPDFPVIPPSNRLGGYGGLPVME